MIHEPDSLNPEIFRSISILFTDYSLYLATDSCLLPDSESGHESFMALLDGCLASGVSVLQLRLKKTPARVYYEIGRQVRALTLKWQVPMIVNDRVDLALALQADGVHVGTSDLPPEMVRQLMPRAIVGYSVNTLEDLACAERAGVDYIGVGPVFRTATKLDTGPVLGIEGVRRLIARTTRPCVAIGGISLANAGSVMAVGAAGVCVISSVFLAADPALEVKRLRACVETSKT